MKHFAIPIIAAILACTLYVTSPNPYPNEINGMKIYGQYLKPLIPRKSDTAQVVQVLGSDERLELKDWKILALYYCAEDILTCSQGSRNDLLDTLEVTPKHRISLHRFKFPTVFSRSIGSVSEINVICDIYADEFGLEYWVVSEDFPVSEDSPSHRKGDLLMIRYGPRRATVQGRVQNQQSEDAGHD
ncbi:MAG: hypothetical protein ABSF68_18085 [Candidatus Acidiferrales bacterium]